MADHSKPLVTSTYANFVTELDGRFDDIAKGLDPATTTPTNLPTGAIRWNSASRKWEKWSGTAWADLTDSYNINLAGPLTLTANSSSDALRITQTGAGNALVVEDSANPDSTPFVVTGTGDVGIGTSAPVTKLDVIGQIRAAVLDGGAQIKLERTGTNAGSSWIGADSASLLNVRDSSFATKMLLDSSGNLGLGVTPSAWSGYGSVLELPANGVVTAKGAFFTTSNAYNNSGWKYTTTAAATSYIQANGVHAWSTAPSGTAGNAISFNQAMTLDANGRLGIGTTSPTSGTLLDVAGTGRFSSGIFVSATATRAQFGLSAPAYQQEGTGGSSATMSLYANLANASGPQFVLGKSRGTANGSNTIVQANDNIGQITFAGTDGTQPIIGAAIVGAVDGTPGTNDMPGRLMFFTTADGSATTTERMRINSSGNVGIGGTTPNSKLKVYVQTDGDGILLDQNGITRLSLTADTTNLSAKVSSGNVFLDLESSNASSRGIRFFTGSTSTERMRIDSAGYLRMASGSGGIQFNGDTAAANALDDYEEGTFTPSVIGTTTAGTGTYVARSGNYTKIGNRVFFNTWINMSSHTGSGNMRVTGLPFTARTGSPYSSLALSDFNGVITPANTAIIASIGSTTDITLATYSTSSGVATATALVLDTSCAFNLSGHYDV